MSTFKLVALALAASATVLLAGCSGLPQKADETAAWTTNKLYSEAQDAMSSKDWTKCSKYFEQVQGRDPFGPHAQQSQLNVAYCNYRDNEQAQANTSIDRFIKLHPDHPDIAYAYYLKGLINFNDDLGLFGRWGRAGHERARSEGAARFLRFVQDGRRQISGQQVRARFRAAHALHHQCARRA
ncbi:MAG: outer membrane protein assembly factor BamD [Pararobbsia sp.]